MLLSRTKLYFLQCVCNTAQPITCLQFLFCKLSSVSYELGSYVRFQWLAYLHLHQCFYVSLFWRESFQLNSITLRWSCSGIGFQLAHSPILLNDINLVVLRYNSGTIKMLNSNFSPSCTKRTIHWTVISYISSSCESQGSITVLFSVIKCIHNSPKNTGHWAVSIGLHILHGIFQQTPVLCSNCRK